MCKRNSSYPVGIEHEAGRTSYGVRDAIDALKEFVADFWIASEVDEPVELEVAEGFEEIGGPILVDRPLSLGHESSFEAISRKDVATEMINYLKGKQG